MESPDELWAAVEEFDAESADLALDALLWDVPLSGAVTSVVLPFLRELGDRWEDGRLSVGHEHFASNLVRRRLDALTPRHALEPRPARGPVVLLACPPGERHDMVLLCVALMLGERGVRVRFLGADTPVPSLVAAARTTAADAVVLAATRDTALTAHATSLARLGLVHPVYVGGRGTNLQVAGDTGSHLLPRDPVRAVAELVGDLSRRVTDAW